MIDDKAIPLRPELIEFSPVKAGEEHVLRIVIHTANLGTFVLPATPAQAEGLARTLLSYVDKVADYEAQQV